MPQFIQPNRLAMARLVRRCVQASGDTLNNVYNRISTSTTPSFVFLIYED